MPRVSSLSTKTVYLLCRNTYKNTIVSIRLVYLQEYQRTMSICIDLTVEPPKVLHSCSICLDMSESPYWLGCHVFCKSCISDWVLTSASCPTCRVNIPDELVQDLRAEFPRRSGREHKPTVMFTTNGYASSTVTSHEMMERVENIE